MGLTRAVTSSIDKFAARLAYITERVTTLERSSHRHNTPATNLQPVGSVQHYLGTTAPDGWLAMNGQTITNGETLYPDFWAIIPASMKSGADIVLPDCRGRVIAHQGSAPFNTFASTLGAATVALTTAQLPSHSHGGSGLSASNSGALSMSGSTSVSGTTSASGTLSVSGTTGIQPGHNHNIGGGAQLWYVGSPTFAYGQVSPTGAPMLNSGAWAATGALAGEHSHSVSASGANHSHSFSGSGSVSTSGGDHTHTVSGSTSAAGSGQAHANIQPSLVLLTIVKVV